MSMKIAEPTAAIAAAAPVVPLPLAERMLERDVERPRERPRDDDRKQRNDASLPPIVLLPPVPLPAPALQAMSEMSAMPPPALSVGAEPSPAAGEPSRTVPVPPALVAATEAPSLSQPAGAVAPPPARAEVPEPPRQASASATDAAPAPPAPTERNDADTRVQRPVESAPLLQPAPAVPAAANLGDSAAGLNEALQQARQQAASSSQHQQVKASQHVQAMQQVQAARSEASARVDVTFRSWGAGHTVMARMDGPRLQLQPSSTRLQQALSTATLPGDVDLDVAIGDATDQQRRGQQEHPSS